MRHRRQVIEPEVLAEESEDEGKAGREDKGSEDEDEEEEELDEEVMLSVVFKLVSVVCWDIVLISFV